MRIDKRIHDRVTYLEVAGDVDLLDAIELREVGRSALVPDCSTLRIDLSGVTFVDSSGLAALVAIRNEALAAHVLVLDNVPPTLQWVLRISGLDGVFNIQ